MNGSTWTRSIRRALALTLTLVLLAGMAPWLPWVDAAEGCGPTEWSAAFYLLDSEGNWESSPAATACVAAPTGTQFAPDLSTLPDAVKDAATYRVVFTGTLAATAGWHSFTANGSPTVTIDGLQAVPGSGGWIDLNSSNGAAVTYTWTSGAAPLSVAWSAAPLCTGQVQAVYAAAGSDSRQALLVRCEAGPGAAQFARSNPDFPSAVGSGGFTATYTGSFPVTTGAWYQFSGSAGGSNSLTAALEGEDLLAGTAGGYLELTAGEHPFTVTYSYTSGPKSFSLSWEAVSCETGTYLAAYYDKGSGKGRAGVVRCEALPGGAIIANGKSAKWTGQSYFEGGTYQFTGTGGTLKLATSPAITVSLSATPQSRAVPEGLHTVEIEAKATGGADLTLDVTATNGATGQSIPRCLEGMFLQELYPAGSLALPRTCVAMPAAGPASGTATWTGRLWFQGGSHQFSGSGITNLKLNGTAVSGATPIAEGRHDLTFSATGPAAIALTSRVVGDCPDGTFRSTYTAGGAVRFGACEARPDYQWGGLRPPGLTGAFSATWEGAVTLLDGGLYRFAATGDSAPTLLVGGAAGSLRDLTLGSHDLHLTYDGSGASPRVALAWDSPATGLAAPYCPEGFYRAEYYAGGDLTGQPYLTLCERRPELTHLRSFMSAPASVRWTGTVRTEGGLFSLTTTAGGSATLYLDGARVHQAQSADGLDVRQTSWDLVRGVHEVVLEWRSTGALHFARLQVTPPISCPTGALTLRYFTNAAMTGQVGGDRCESGSPVHQWGSLEPVPGAGDQFAASWAGTVNFTPGRYRFYLQAVGGVTAKIDGKDLFVEFNPDVTGGYRSYDLWVPGPKVADAEVTLTGNHTLAITFAKNPTNQSIWPESAAIRFWWEPAAAPVLTAGRLAGDTVILSYSDTLDERVLPGAASFLVSDLNDVPLTVTGTAISGNSLTLNLASGFTGAEAIVRYDPERSGSIRAKTLTSLPATNLARGRTPDLTGGYLLDLGAVSLLSHLKVHTAGDGYRVEISTDGTSFTTVHTASSATPPYLKLDFAPTQAARWVRLMPTGSGLPTIAGLEAWGVEAGAPAALPAPVAGVNPANVALGKVTAMSGPALATGGELHSADRGVNGYTTRRIENRDEVWDYFATGPAMSPWWRVDLDGLYLLTSLRIFNRADANWDEAASLQVFVATTATAPAPDSGDWTRIHPLGDAQVGAFGGPSSPYLRVDFASVPARHLMLRLGAEEEKILHLAEVEVFGVRATPSLIVRRDTTAPTLATELVGGVSRQRLDALDDYVILRFHEDLDPSALPSPTDFTVSVDGRLVSPLSVQIYQRDLTLYLGTADRLDPTMLVGAKYTGSTVRDVSGNAAAQIPFLEAKYLAITPVNLAQGKPTAISSTAGSNGAFKGVNDKRYYDGGAPDYFQTNVETDPWWSVDLAGVYSLQKIRLFNRVDGGQANAANLQVQVATACTNWAAGNCAWETVYDNAQQNSGALFGLEPGSFLTVKLFYNNARYLRVRLPGAGQQLNLSEVQVYGRPAVQIFNLSALRPATVIGKNGTVTQTGGFYPVPGETPPAGSENQAQFSPARANDSRPATFVTLVPTDAVDPACDCLWTFRVNLQSSYLLTGLRLTLDAAQVTAFRSSATTYIEVSADGSTWSHVPHNLALYSGNRLTLPIGALQAQYLRIRTRGLGQINLYEAEVLGFPAAHLTTDGTLTNLSREKPAALFAQAGTYTQWFNRYLSDPPAVGNLNNPQYNPAWAVDGNSTTYAELQARTAVDPDCTCKLAWTVDLQAEYPLLKLVVTLPDNAAAVTFKNQALVEIKVGADWVAVPFNETGLVSGATVTIPLPGLSAQYLRILATNIPVLRLREVEIFGYAPQIGD